MFRRIVPPVVLALLFVNICRCAAAERKKVSFEKLQTDFADPEMIYAPFAFWFWDTPLDPALTAAMAKEMTRQRLNPGYAHPPKRAAQ